MSTTTTTGTGLGGVSRTQVGIGAVDVLLVGGLVIYGHLHHGGDPLADPLGSAAVAFPFLLGWILVSILAGVYARAVYADPLRTARLTIVCWIAAANVGLLLRSSPYFDGGVAYPFGFVMTGVGLAALVPWRVAYAVYIRD